MTDTIKKLLNEKKILINRIQIIDKYLEDVLVNGCDCEYLKPKTTVPEEIKEEKGTEVVKEEEATESVSDSKTNTSTGKVSEIFARLIEKYGNQKKLSEVSGICGSAISIFSRSNSDRMKVSRKTRKAIETSNLEPEEKDQLLRLIDYSENENPIVRIRKQKGMTQLEFGENLDLGEATIVRLEKGTHKVSESVFTKFMNSDMFTGSEKDELNSFFNTLLVRPLKFTDFGKELESIRHEINLTRNEFAEILSFAYSTYSKLLTKKVFGKRLLEQIENSVLDEKYKEKLRKFFKNDEKSETNTEKVAIVKKKLTPEQQLDRSIDTFIRNRYDAVSRKELRWFVNYIKEHKLDEINETDRDEIRLAKEELRDFVKYGHMINQFNYNHVMEIFRTSGYTEDMTEFFRRYKNFILLKIQDKHARFDVGLKDLRRLKSLTQREIASKLGTYPTRISGIEMGDKVPTNIAYGLWCEFGEYETKYEHPGYWLYALKNQSKPRFVELMKTIMQKYNS